MQEIMETTRYKVIKTTPRRVLVCVLAVSLTGLRTLAAQDTGYFYNETQNVLVYGGSWYAHYIGKPDSPEKGHVYVKLRPNESEGPGRVIHEGALRVSRLEISPNGRYVSFIESGKIGLTTP